MRDDDDLEQSMQRAAAGCVNVVTVYSLTGCKETQQARRRPSNLTIVPPNDEPFTTSPLSSSYNGSLLSSTSNLMAAIFSDMLRSPALSAGACPRSASVHKALPTRPRSASVPSTPDLPVELPGSLLQHNQGFPYIEVQDSVSSRPISQNIRRGTHPPDRNVEDECEILDLLHLFPEPLNHSKSVPVLNAGYRESAMKSSRTESASSANAYSRSKPQRIHHRRALSDIEWRTLSDSNRNDYNIAVPDVPVPFSNAPEQPRSETDSLPQPSQASLDAGRSNRPAERRASRLNNRAAHLTTTSSTARSTITANVQNINATQDQTIATLRAQFSGLRASHEAHVSSLAEAHTAEVASLRDYTRLLEEQLARRSSLHHDVQASADAQLASSVDPLIFLDTSSSPSTLSRESSQHTADTSASSTLSYWSALDKQSQLPARPENSPEMESLKRKLSTTRRPPTADRNLLPELNQYKQNNAALQTQISSLMAKLNESKKSEKALKATLQDVEQRCAEAERQSREAQQLGSNAQALQNTIDHLENRLEIANTEKLDAQEELFNIRALKSPFDAQFPELQMPTQTAHESMDTVFSTDSDQRHESSATLSKYVAHVEHLEDEMKQRNAYIAELEGDGSDLRLMLDQMGRQCDEMNLQLDIQNELLGRAKETDRHTEQLRAAVMDREAVIAEKEKSIRTVERQLEHHKLLLQAEIRKHATTAQYFTNDSNPLPELTALATNKDIDRWIQKLNQRLRKAKPMSPTQKPANVLDEQIEDLRNEIEFYVREIIYYKLDIRGYKSDIKKLNKITAQLGSYGNRTSDLDSDTSSLRPAPTPNRPRFLSTTPELKGSEQPSPVLAGPISANTSPARAVIPPKSGTARSPTLSPSQQAVQTSDAYQRTVTTEPVAQTGTKATITQAAHELAPHRNLDSSELQHDMAAHVIHGYKSAGVTEATSASNYDDHSQMLALAIGDPWPSTSRDADISGQDDSRPNVDRDNSSDARNVQPVVPISKYSREFLSKSPLPKPQHAGHSRVSSGSSTLSYTVQSQATATQPERKLSSASSTGIPFVLAMSSPHNPAIAVAAKNMPATRPHKAASTTSRIGIAGTMASSTPLSSPTSIKSLSSGPAASSPAPTGQKRKLSLSFKRQEIDTPTTPTHSRSLSGGSIRTAIRWSKGTGKEKENQMQNRKDSIGMPQFLSGPHGLDREADLPTSESRVDDFATSQGGTQT